jgi:hypothetical protein
VAFFRKTLDALVKDSKVLERQEMLDLLTVHHQNTDPGDNVKKRFVLQSRKP